MVAKELNKNSGSLKLELGEIDTSAPFQSVKDAVNLFGEVAFSGRKPSITKTKDHSAERAFAKETELHLAEKELDKLKEQLENTETTKSQAHTDLARAKRTIDELSQKLKVVGESKEFATKEIEEAKNRVKLIKQGGHCISRTNDDSLREGLEAKREKYSIAIDSVKQLLRSIHEEYDASLAERITAINQAEAAELAAKLNCERVDELSREIATLQASISQLQRETAQTDGEEAKIHNQRSTHQQLFNANFKVLVKKLETSKKNFDAKLSENLSIQLASTISDIVVLQNQIDYAKTSDLDSLKIISSELNGAKESLQKLAEEQCSLQSLVEALKLEMENVKKEQSQLKEMETETESNDEKMQIEIQKAKLELEEAHTAEAKVIGASEEMISTLYKLVLDSENAKLEAEEMIKQADRLKKESKSTRVFVEEAEKKLGTALEEAKTAETSAIEEMKRLSERSDASSSSTSESVSHISISREEFDSLNRKVEESDALAEMKVAAAMSEVEAVKASENEALKKVEAMQKEIDEMIAITDEAQKKTGMAEAARKVVQGELRRWREREQKAASRTLAETEMNMGSSPQNYNIQKVFQPRKKAELRKLEKSKTSTTNEVLRPNLSYIFHKKRNKVEGGSPAYLPDEMPI